MGEISYQRIKPQEICQAGYDALVRAVVAQAAADWRHSVKAGKARTKAAGDLRDECERFFRSKWFEALTGVRGDYILEKLRREYEGERVF